MAKKSVAKRTASAKSKAAEPKSTKSSQSALSVADNVKAYEDVSTSNRWATIKKTDGTFDKDAREEVINISLMEGGVPPAPNELAEKGNEHADTYSFQKVAGGVIIGMRRGGPFESVDGFGWKDAADKAAHGNPVGAGSTRVVDASAA